MALPPCEADTPEVSETRDSFQRWLQEHFSDEPSCAAGICEATSRLSEGRHRQLEVHIDNNDGATPTDDCVEAETNRSAEACLSNGHMPDAGMSRQRVELPQPARLPGKNSKRNQTKAQKEAHKRYREKKRQRMFAMEAEVHSKSQLLLRLQWENRELQSHSRALETAIDASQDALDVLNLLGAINISSTATEAAAGVAGAGAAAAAAQVSAEAWKAAAAGAVTGAKESSGWHVLMGCKKQGIAGSSASGATAAAAQTSSPIPGGWGPCTARVPENSSAVTAAALRTSEGFWAAAGRGAASLSSGPSAEAAAAAAGGGGRCTRLESSDGWHSPPSSSSSLCNSNSMAYAAAVAEAVTAAAAAGSAGPMPLSRAGSMTMNTAESCNIGSAAAAVQQGFPEGPHQGINGVGLLRADRKQAEQNALRAAGYVSDWEGSLQAYKEFVVQVANLLQRAEGAVPDPSAYQELEVLTWSWLDSMKPWMAHMGQELVYQWQNRNLETGTKDDCSILWPRVLAKLNLSPKQEADLLACYKMFEVCLTKLLEERRLLAAQYAALQGRVEEALRDGGTEVVPKLHQDSEHSLHLLQRISKNLKAYGSLDNLFATSVVRILSGVQLAKGIMHSYPYLPFWHEMVNHMQKLASQRQQQQQHGLALLGGAMMFQPLG